MEKMLELATKRIEFLRLLQESDGDLDNFHNNLRDFGHLSESVAENTSKDRVSHFLLRLVAARSNYDVRHAIVHLESRLFSYRLQATPLDAIQQSLGEVRRHLQSIIYNQDDSKGLLASLHKAVNKIIEGNMMSHDGDSCSCGDKNVQVLFEIVAPMVAKRQVVLHEGLAVIKCGQIRTFLSCVFSNLLLNSLRQMALKPDKYATEEDDNRMTVLISRARKQFTSVMKVNNSTSEVKMNLTAAQVDVASKYFPLCFHHVHKQLKRHKRLGHHARVAYTLFLKEIGLPKEEAVKFWSEHYSQNRSDCSCDHTWKEHSKKFLYSIDHLYGQAGGRKNYSAHSCSSVADRSSSPHEQLVCPFVALDIEDLGHRLESYMSTGTKHVVAKEDILQAVTVSQNERKACGKLLQCHVTNEEESITKPSQYFGSSWIVQINE